MMYEGFHASEPSIINQLSVVTLRVNPVLPKKVLQMSDPLLLLVDDPIGLIDTSLELVDLFLTCV